MVLPSSVPVMTIQSATLFPQALLPLYIFEQRYRQMLSDMLKTDRMFSVAMQKPDKQRETPCRIAGLGLIRVSVGHDDGTSHLILQGLTRVELVETVRLKPYRVAAIRPLMPADDDRGAVKPLVAKVQALVEERVHLGPFPYPFAGIKNTNSEKAEQPNFSPKDVLEYLESLPDPEHMADLVSCALLPGAIERQTILEAVSIEDRLRLLIRFLSAEIRRLREDQN